ncbi:MAG: PQQ-dependent sugar dehydrogenase [Gemmatimonadota bacterium]|nr:MAG: PQQ-dependent sugar dehydrogenase [Gemmatimonadota bacterium]
MAKLSARTAQTLLLLVLAAAPAPAQEEPVCALDNAGLTLPPGFCALAVADGLGRARHLTVARNGDVFVATGRTRQDTAGGGVVVLRDTDGDGVADERVRFGGGTGNDVEFRGGFLYYSTDDAIMRYPWQAGSMEPAGPADTMVSELPARGGHRAKSFVFGSDGAIYVNVGSPSNACQEQQRTVRSPGKDPCEELEQWAGIWRFDPDRPGQRQPDGSRYATGMRNTVALGVRAQDGELYAAIHGRDQLTLWPDLFDDAMNAEKPAEEFVRIREGSDFGWPYCYYDPALEQKVLAPEYGGDGRAVGRCAEKDDPLIGFPAHWAPNGIHFYVGNQYPQRYRGGAFIAFHGSWNRAPLPQGGYNVVFAPFDGDEPTGAWEVFADGFAGRELSPRGAEHRPVGLAEGPDGSLYVSDDRGGRIYRIVYRGAER